MPKRGMTADAARAYLQSQNYPGADKLSDAYAKRLARGKQAGKPVKEVRGHGRTEHHYRRVESVVYGQSQSRAKVTEFAMGKRPDDTREPDAQRAGVPQPADLIRLVERYTKSRLINVGIVGYLLVYLDPQFDQPGYVEVHTWVEREWFLRRLKMLPQNHLYTASSPAYLKLAHDCVEVANNPITGQDDSQTWQWGAVYRWSVRDMR